MEAQKGKLKHDWHHLFELLQSETAAYFVCKRCGVVQNDQNVDKSCKGKVKMRPDKDWNKPRGKDEREGS
jgi:hypothetical protein